MTADQPVAKPKIKQRVKHQTVAISDNQLTIVNGIASATQLSRHAVMRIVLRHGIAAVSHMSKAELWAMLPPYVKSRLRRLGVEPAERHTLRERLRQRKIAKAFEDTEEP